MHSGLLMLDRPRRGLPVETAAPPDCAVHRSWPWRRRVASAARRRLSAWWQRWTDQGDSSPIEAALSWLNEQIKDGRLPSRAGTAPCPGLTAALVPALLEFGQLDLVEHLTEWLVSRQRPDGGFPRAGADEGSLFNTAQALGALVALNDAGAMADAGSVFRAADCLATRLESDLRAPLPGSCLGDDRRARSAEHVCCAASLLAASRSLDSPRWRCTAERVAARARRSVDWHVCTSAGRLRLHAADAWIALGDTDLAHEILRWPTLMQRRDGAVPADRRRHWGENDVLAHLAALWYKLGDRDCGDRAIRFLNARQLPGGGWPTCWGRHAGGGESAWTARHYLDAARLQVASSFAGSHGELPLTIDCRDERFTAVRDCLASLGPTAKVADVGCGTGRFLRELIGHLPNLRLVGIDPSPAALERLPPGVEPRRGGLLRIPAKDGEFDATVAVESLEHSLLPERAVSELCRVVRPGGRILIVDKHLAQQPLSLHAPWERWFLPVTVTRWLAPYCREIDVRPIAHGHDSQPDGLFLCWQAVRA
jgi:malonyl-CoA O-methyltransferase